MNTAEMSPAALVRSAWAAYARNELHAAIASCRQALALDPSHIEALATLGFLLHAARQFDESAEVFAKLTELQPEEPAYWMNLGTARRCSGRLDDALAAYAGASDRGANSADFFYNVGLTHIDRNDFEAGPVLIS